MRRRRAEQSDSLPKLDTGSSSAASGLSSLTARYAGCSVLYHALLGLHSEKGGDVARLWQWGRGWNRTLWRHDFIVAASDELLPTLRQWLRHAPGLASQQCDNRQRTTPLHLAAFLGAPAVITLLLEHGAQAGVTNQRGGTPLDEAMGRGNGEAVTLLFRALPPHMQQAARAQLAAYLALPDASLRREQLGDDLGLPATIARRAARVDPLPASRTGGRLPCSAEGGWRAHVPGAAEAAADEASDIDQRVGLSETEYFRDYFLLGRPVLIRNAASLAERCALAASSEPMHSAATQTHFQCGATAYPDLTGRRACGTYSFIDLISNPRCTDQAATRPVCNWKLGKVRKRPLPRAQGMVGAGEAGNAAGLVASNPRDDGVNSSAGFMHMPSRFRHPSHIPPMSFMRGSWNGCTSRALWGGTASSGSGFHYHNAAYNMLFFGTKKWMLTPPRYSGLSDLDSIDWPDEQAQSQLPAGLPLRFTQRAGDLVIVPSQWGHSTLSHGGFTIGLGVLW